MHNFKNYDSHPIMLALEKVKGKYKQISCLAKGIEKYSSVSLSMYSSSKVPFKIIFKDSYQFLTSSLENLIKSLKTSGGVEKFQILQNFYQNKKELDLLTRKGVCPYEYVDSITKFSDRCLPPIEEFYSSLKGPTEEDDYEHAINVLKAFSCETLRDYWFLYLKSDVLQLADVFENF